MKPSAAKRHDLVVIGASAGGVEALRRVVAGFPKDLNAAVCVVLHISPGSPSALAGILERAGPLPCHTAVDGDALRPGQIYVAAPDHHLTVANGRIRLSVGPRENGHRPAVDVLFRSAAAEHDGRTIGVVLSGTRDDGSAGLAVIKAQGGATVVQDPREALYAGMPASAIAHVSVDAVVPSDQVAAAIVALVDGAPVDVAAAGMEPSVQEPPVETLVETEPLTTICPECGGVLTERRHAGVMQWQCRVGHRYSAESMLNAQAEDVEAALWAAIRALEDRRLLLGRLAERFDAGGQKRAAETMHARAAIAAAQADVVRGALARAAPGPLGESPADPSHNVGDHGRGTPPASSERDPDSE